MIARRDNKNMSELKGIENSKWKGESAGYLKELEGFLDRIKKIKEEKIRRDILMSMLKTDNELALLAEKLFQEYYSKGYAAGKAESLKGL